MLNRLSKLEMKAMVILLVFNGLLQSILTVQTIIFSIVGCALVWLQIKPSKLIRNISALALFASYWFTYGKVIDPEIGLNFLTSIIVIKLLEKENERDSYIIFFGLLLLISAGSLFEKNLNYVLFFGMSFLILIQDFYKFLKLPYKLWDLSKSFIWVMPLTVFFFFFVPRMMNPLPMGRGGPGEGEVGYTPGVNISEIESLSFNDQNVFQALVDESLPNEKLYWRGNTLSFNDGWNWPMMPQDKPSFSRHDLKDFQGGEGYSQTIRLIAQEEFFFALDHAHHVFLPEGAIKLNQTRTLGQKSWRTILKYQALSFPSGVLKDESPTLLSYLSSSLSLAEKEWIHRTFQGISLDDLQKEIRNYFGKEGFHYSLSPGKITSFQEFMKVKKIGFCSHYASALALILRTKGIPSRLVSGFLGGNYNRFASFYQVTQNDAHVWVEAFSNGEWKRLDPTGWIAPDRVRLGGTAFLSQEVTVKKNHFQLFDLTVPWVNDLKQWLGQWDFKFYTWLEEMDYYGQEALFARLHFRKEWIFTLLPLMLAFFMGLYTWYLSRDKKDSEEHELVFLWREFSLKLHQRGIGLPLLSLQECRNILINSKDLEKEKILTIFNNLVIISFRGHDKNLEWEIKQGMKSL